MKYKPYKIVVFTLSFLITIGVFAQKTSKSFSEKFNVNKDVEIQIDATNTEIDVSTWNKNEVSVEAFIEIEGMSKEAAEKYLKKYKFEALGNKGKVKITSKNSGIYSFNDNIVIFNNDSFKFPEIVILEIPKMPEINLQDLETIVIPEMDFDKMFIDFDKMDFDFDQYNKDGKSYFFSWKDGVNEIKIKSKKEWEDFKKSKEYVKWKAEMKANTEKIKKELASIKFKFSKAEQQKIKESLSKARESVKKIEISKIRKELAKARETMKDRKFSYMFNSENEDITIDGKKVKIKKKLVIKVPKKATFNLNTRHCKVKLPASKTVGKVSYGSFNATGLENANLSIYFSPVNVTTVNQSNLTLNNVTDAILASVTNSNVKSTSGNLTITELFNNTNLSASFGDLEVLKVNPSVSKLSINLQQADAILNFLDFKDKLVITTNDTRSSIAKDTQNKKTVIQGNFKIKSINDFITILGRYSELLIKK